MALEPFDQAVEAGQPVTFASIGNGSGVVSYQWQMNGADIAGATQPTYTIPAASAADNGAIFRVKVSNGVSIATSHGAILTVE